MDNFTVCAGLSYSSRKLETTLESTKKGWVQREGDTVQQEEPRSELTTRA